MSTRPPESEPTTCRECGAMFNLAAQNYYDNLCPECVDDERTWPLCWGCSERVDPDEAEMMKVRGGPRDPGAQYVPVHPGCNRNQAPPGGWPP